jgi:hypothetical protein
VPVYPQRSSLDGGCSVILSAPQILTSTVSRPILALERERRREPRAPLLESRTRATLCFPPRPRCRCRCPAAQHAASESNQSPETKREKCRWEGRGRGSHSMVVSTARGFVRHPSGNATLPLPWRSKTRMAREALEQFRPRWGRLRAVTVGNG